MNDFDKNFHINFSPLYFAFAFMLFMLWASEVKADEIEELVLLVRKQLSYLFLFNGAVMVFCLANAESIISIIYERGAFNSTNTLTVASIFSIIVFAILPWSMNQVLTRSYCINRGHAPAERKFIKSKQLT